MRRSPALFGIASPLLPMMIGMQIDLVHAQEFIIRPSQFRVEKRIEANAKEFDLPSLKATLVFSIQ